MTILETAKKTIISYDDRLEYIQQLGLNNYNFSIQLVTHTLGDLQEEYLQGTANRSNGWHKHLTTLNVHNAIQHFHNNGVDIVALDDILKGDFIDFYYSIADKMYIVFYGTR